MSLVDFLTPKDTEEVKPDLFIQKTSKGYRQITPMAWNGKINWKNTLLGNHPIRNLFWFGVLMFLVYSYRHDVQAYQDFYINVHEHIRDICSNPDLRNNISIDFFKNNFSQINFSR